MAKTEKFSDLGEISAATVRLGQLLVDAFSVTCNAVTQKPIDMVLAELQ